MTKVLFVCLGNICRSAAAEAVFSSFVEQAGLSDRFEIDSAGTASYHVGEPADSRMIKFGASRGFDLTSIARELIPRDFEVFDYIIVMDDSNFANAELLRNECNSPKAKLCKMTDYCARHKVSCVPDPYYGGEEGFLKVFDILEDSCSELLVALR